LTSKGETELADLFIGIGKDDQALTESLRSFKPVVTEVIQVRGAGVGHANEVKKEPNKGAFTSTTQPNEVKEALEVSTTLERRITEADEYIYQTLIT